MGLRSLVWSGCVEPVKPKLWQASLGQVENFVCVFGNGGECAGNTGLWQVSDVRVWKFQCWS